MQNLVKWIKFLLLGPFSFVCRQFYKLRRILYQYRFFECHDFAVPIISVGNISFGGTGKTPFTLWLANYFITLNKRPMILTRGYRGRLEKSSGILKAGNAFMADAELYGDEPTMMALRMKKGSVVVGKDRVSNLKKYFDEESPDVVLLDDGHQHLKILRNLNIVLFDSLVPIDKYRVAPLGILREGISALKDAHIIVLGHNELASSAQKNKLKTFISPHLSKSSLIVETSYESSGAYNGLNRKVFELLELKGKKVIALSGLASPVSFWKMLDNLEVDIIQRVKCRDHCHYNKKDVEKYLALANKEQAIILTTEKDMVKIKNVLISDKILFIDVSLKFITGEKELTDLLARIRP